MLRAGDRLFRMLGFVCGFVACTTLPPLEPLGCDDDSHCPMAFVCSDKHICIRGTKMDSSPVATNADSPAPATAPSADRPAEQADAAAPPVTEGTGADAQPMPAGSSAAESVATNAGASAPPTAGSAGAAAPMTSAGAAAAPVCVANTTSCEQSTMRTCKADRSGYSSIPCAFGCRPDGSSCNSCRAGEHLCAGECVSNASVNSCGTRCTACPMREGAVPTCINEQCGLVCETDTFECQESTYCVPRRLDFEAGLDGWVTVQSAGSTGQEAPTRSTEVVHGGSYAARSTLDVGGDRHAYQFLGPLCEEGLDLRGVTATFWVYIKPNGSTAGTHDCNVYGFDRGSVSIVDVPRTTIPESRWTRLTGTVSNDASGAKAGVVGIVCSIATNSATWTGAIYIDDITFE
jgi:hypothetical protein